MPSYEQLLKSFNNFETNLKDNLINIIPLPLNAKGPKIKKWDDYFNKPYPIDQLKNHKGNFGILMGYNPNNNDYWIGCLDIDGVKTNESTEKATKKEFYNILKQLKGTIQVKTHSGGYHIYFLTKKKYTPQYIDNISFPKDYHIKELANTEINTAKNKPLEIFTHNRQMALPPSRIYKNKYKVISDLKDFNKLKIYDDPLKDIHELLKEHGFIYKKPKELESTYKRNNTSFDRITDHKQLTQSEIVTISYCLTPYFALTSGIHSELYMALSGYFKKYEIAIETATKIITLTMKLSNDKDKDHLRELKSTYKRTNKKQTGLTRFKEILEKNKQIDNNQLTKDIIKIDSIINPKYTKKIFPTTNLEKLKKFNDLKANKYDNNVAKYITDISKYMILNEEHNILKQVLINLSTIIFKEGLFNQVQGDKDTGKTYTIETGLEYIPKEHIQKINSTTRASFINEAKENKYCYDQMILYGGDLGDKETLEHIKNEIFDILKILISEKEYTTSKMINPDGIWEKETIEIIGSPCFAFCTVEPLISSKSQQQVESRTITTTPLKHDRQSKLRYQNKITREYRNENRKYTETIKKLSLFHEYIRYLRDNVNKYVVDIVFYETIDDFTSLSETDTRQAKLQKTLFKIYSYINKDQCNDHKIEDKIILMPTIELLEQFLDIMAGDVGIKRYEKDVLLSLKEYLQIPTEQEVNNLINSIEEEIMDEDQYIRDERLESAIAKRLITEYGLNKNRKQQTLTESETYFFTVSKFNETYKNNKDLKKILRNIGNIENIKDTFNKLYDEGYLEKTELIYRNSYVYYLTDKINKIKLKYELKEKTIEYDIKQLETLKNTNNKSIFGEIGLKKLKEKYVKSYNRMSRSN